MLRSLTVFGVLCALLAFASSSNAQPHPLVGTWEEIDGRTGFDGGPGLRRANMLIVGPDGYYMTLALPPNRPKVNKPLTEMTREELLARFAEIHGNRGSYSISGDRWTTDRLASIDPNEEPRRIVRIFRIEGDVLTLTAADPAIKVQSRWRRLKPAHVPQAGPTPSASPQAAQTPKPRAVTAETVLTAAPAGAQWRNVPVPATPRTPDGRPDLSASAPTLSDGKPDLSGIWRSDNTSDLTVDIKPSGVPFQPWARALYEQRKDGARAREDPPTNCLPPGIPRIFLDGRELAPLDQLNPTWLGYSTAKWEGDTLAVETRGFNGKAWLDQAGKPTTEALRLVERFRRTNFGTMEIEITIDDPEAYTEPWTISERMRLLPSTELMEFICNENNRALEILPRNWE